MPCVGKKSLLRQCGIRYSGGRIRDCSSVDRALDSGSRCGGSIPFSRATTESDDQLSDDGEGKRIVVSAFFRVGWSMDRTPEKQPETVTEIRINRYLAEAGVASRREADRLIEDGRVAVCRGGTYLQAETGMKIGPADTVLLDGKQVKPESGDKTYLILHKPKGVVCTSSQKEKNNVIDYVGFPKRLTYAGRLDKDSTGLLLMTDDGALIDALMRARNRHEKEYRVRVDRPVEEDFLRAMAEGVPILNTVTRPCTVRRTGRCTFTIILTQGLNRQIRRMCEALGYRVTSLTRVRIGSIRLGDLPEGAYRELDAAETAALKRDCGLAGYE